FSHRTKNPLIFRKDNTALLYYPNTDTMPETSHCRRYDLLFPDPHQPAMSLFSKTMLQKAVKTCSSINTMLFAALLLSSLVAMVDILPYQGSTLTLLVIAAIAIVALAFFRLIIPLVVAAIVAVVLVILLFGGIPVPG